MHSELSIEEKDLASLRLPAGTNGKDLLHWRLRLIEKMKICDLPALLKAGEAHVNNRLDSSERKRWVRLAMSHEVVMDDLEYAALVATAILLGADKMSDEMVLTYEQYQSKKQYNGIDLKTVATENPEYVQFARETVRFQGQVGLMTVGSRVRAKFALQEIVAVLSPDEMIPFLVGQSEKYLSCPTVQGWLRLKKEQAQFADLRTRKKAAELLKAFTRSLIGDRRSKKPRRYSYWYLHRTVDRITAEVKFFRAQAKKGSVDKSHFDVFCSYWKIPNHLRPLVISKNPSPKDMALEILVALGRIKNPKSFREFQPEINRLKRKHDGIEYLPIIESMIDFPFTNPEIAALISIGSVLEKVSLRFCRP